MNEADLLRAQPRKATIIPVFCDILSLPQPGKHQNANSDMQLQLFCALEILANRSANSEKRSYTRSSFRSRR